MDIGRWGGTTSVDSTSLSYSIPQNAWTHVAFTINNDPDSAELYEDGVARVYINGQLIDETTYERDSDSSVGEGTNPAIGRTHNNTDFFKGYLDDIRMYHNVILTQGEILALVEQSAPVMRFEFDEENGAAHYIDAIGGLVGYPTASTVLVDGTDVEVLNPIPGTDGQIGNVALFDGNGSISVPGSSDAVDLTDDFTVMLWVQTESSDMSILHKGDGDSTFENGEKSLYINGGGFPYFHGNGNSYIRSDEPVNDGLWHHVVVTWDRTAGLGNVYVDGVDQTSSVNYAPNVEDNRDDILQLGTALNKRGANIFDGKMDELVVYQRALTQEEAASIYLRELRWYRDHNSASVQVDTDNPTIELLTTAEYFAEGYTQLVVNTADAFSAVRLLDIGLKAPSDSSYTWWSAPACLDASGLATVWCPYFTTAAEGTYEVVFRAVDIVGNETVSSPHTFYVDTTNPVVGSSYGATALNATQDTSSDGLSWSLPLNGTVSDSANGVYTNTVAVALIDARGETLGGNAQRATVNGSVWSIDYQLSGLPPVGEMTVVVSAEDNVGNATEQIVGTIILDERAPSVALNERSASDTYSTTVTFSGTATEQPDYYGKVLDLHFEDNLLDSTEWMNDAACATCPSYVNGLFGKAVSFTGGESISAEIANITETLSLAGWVYYTTSDNADLITLGSSKAKLATLAGDGLQATLMTINGTYTISSTGSLTANAWNHVALAWDGTEMTAYVNGVAVGTQATSGTLMDGTTVTLGNNAQSFMMQLDEVQVYEVALKEWEAFALAADHVSGVASVEYWLEQVFTDVEQTQNWQAATLTAPNASFTNWSASMTGSGEGFYQLNIRSTDVNGNQSGSFVAWRGQIDTVAPRLTTTAVHSGTGETAQTVFTFTVEDTLLDVSQISSPCAAEAIVFTDTDSVDSAMASCTVAGHVSGEMLTAVDLAGNVSSAEFIPTSP